MIRNHEITVLIRTISRVYLAEEHQGIGLFDRIVHTNDDTPIEIGVITEKQQDLMDMLSHKGLNVNEITYEAKKLSINIKLDFDEWINQSNLHISNSQV